MEEAAHEAAHEVEEKMLLQVGTPRLLQPVAGSQQVQLLPSCPLHPSLQRKQMLSRTQAETPLCVTCSCWSRSLANL